ncbi:MAG: acyl-CoA dehydrogenase-like protein [Burkholderiales bacterium]|jgi:alkylation response protein AidB-like acyl-CoA dehydrogenase|nr:acyl-CoA dehydrogenase-like protein [Burkholderiales bacterium]
MSLPVFRFKSAKFPSTSASLRAEVRAFLEEERAAGNLTRDPHGWARTDPVFSQKLGARGWIGMTWPKKYGGHERHELERYVVTEELLAGGAPMRGHWTADRQTGPLILTYGTDAQRRAFLPEIAAGRCNIAIGLSESDSGSDLAAIRTTAKRTEGGWQVTGSKLWTSNAHVAQYMTAFVRTSPRGEDRHAGVSRLLIDMSSPGVKVRPVINLPGEHDLNEVVLDGVFVADEMVIGDVGGAWQQIGTELSHERSAPDRWLASHDVLLRTLDKVGQHPDRRDAEVIGRAISQLWTLRSMSASIAGMLAAGRNPAVEAAVVKDLATQYDQETPAWAARLVTESGRAGPDAAFAASLRHNLLFAPALTIKGGTREILRNAIARGLGLR